MACPSITSSTAPCLSATAKLLHFFGVYMQQVKHFNWELPPPPQTGLLHRMSIILAK